MSQEILSLIQQARRVLIDLLNVFDDILIKHNLIKCRTVPSKEDRYLLRDIKTKLDR